MEPKWDETEEIGPSWDDTSEVEQPNMSKLASAGLGAVESGTMGFADEIYGAAVGGYKALTGPRDYADTYEEARNEARNVFKNAEQANPKSYMAGQIGGGLATAFVPGVGLAKGASLGANVARGAALGGTAGVGMSQADDFSQDAVKGAFMGGAIGTVAPALQTASSKLSGVTSAIDEKVEQLGRNALGGTLKQSRELAPGIGRQMFDEGYIGPFTSKAKLAERLGAKVGQLGDEASSIIDTVENQSARINTSQMLDSAKQRIQELYDQGFYAKAEAMEKLYSNLASKVPKEIKPSVLENIKRTQQDVFEKGASTASNQAGREMARIQRQSLEQGLSELAPELGEQYAARNQQMSRLIQPLEMAEESAEKIAREGGSGRFLSTERFGPEVYRTLLGPEKSGWALNNFNKLLKFAPEKLGKYAPVLQQAAQKGAHSLAVTNYLLQQKDEEYRNTIKQLEGGDGQ